eukprot:2699842-Amphidinium_carterae.1
MTVAHPQQHPQQQPRHLYDVCQLVVIQIMVLHHMGLQQFISPVVDDPTTHAVFVVSTAPIALLVGLITK